jgi:two-component system, sensor histidine kinase ChiS
VLKPTRVVVGVGDAASIVRKGLRVPDVVGHLGAGVFAVILPETSPADARQLVDSLCVALADAGWPFQARLEDVSQAVLGAEVLLEAMLA